MESKTNATMQTCIERVSSETGVNWDHTFLVRPNIEKTSSYRSVCGSIPCTANLFFSSKNAIAKIYFAPFCVGHQCPDYLGDIRKWLPFLFITLIEVWPLLKMCYIVPRASTKGRS